MANSYAVRCNFFHAGVVTYTEGFPSHSSHSSHGASPASHSSHSSHPNHSHSSGSSSTPVYLIKKTFDTKEIKFPKKQLSELFAVVEPYLKSNLKINENDYDEIKKYIPAELYAKMFLDYDENKYIIANIKFIYDEVEINPLDMEEENKKIPRNMVKETKLLDMLLKTGFMYDQKNSRLVLTSEDKIYNFLSEEIDIYMKNFEILATDSFKEKQIRKAENISVGVRIENNLIDIDLSKLNISSEELKEVMKKYKLKKKYHRLKDGSFLKLEENETIEKRGDGEIFVKHTACDDFSLFQRLLSFGTDLKSLSPDYINEQFLAKLKKIRAGYCE